MTRFRHAVIASCASLVAACGGGGDGDAGYQITYSASGVPPLQVTYSIPGQPLSQVQASSGSFEFAFVARTGDELYISATSQSATFVAVNIAVNGVVVQAGVARGQSSAQKTCCQGLSPP